MRCSFEPHRHSSDCYNAQGELSCGYWDGYIHEHDEKCYDSNGVLICTLEEHPMHKHTDGCYNWEKQLICTLPESEGTSTRMRAIGRKNRLAVCLRAKATSTRRIA